MGQVIQKSCVSAASSKTLHNLTRSFGGLNNRNKMMRTLSSWNNSFLHLLYVPEYTVNRPFLPACQCNWVDHHSFTIIDKNNYQNSSERDQYSI